MNMKPRMSLEAVAEMDRLIKGGSVGLEWGSGTSTVWLAKKSSALWSVESDNTWFVRVNQWLAHEDIMDAQAKVRFFPPDKDCNSTEPCFYKGVSDRARCYRSYVNFADVLTDGSLDYVIVDGRARVGCLFIAMTKLKPGGLLVLDNSERVDRYGLAINALKSWPEFRTEGYVDGIFCRTSFWTRPGDCTFVRRLDR